MLSVFTSFNTMNEWMKLILIGYFHFHIYLSLKLLRMHSTYFFFLTFIMPYFQEKVFLFLFSKNNAERSFNKKPKMGHCYLSCCLCPLALLVSWQEGLGGLFFISIIQHLFNCSSKILLGRSLEKSCHCQLCPPPPPLVVNWHASRNASHSHSQTVTAPLSNLKRQH